MALSGKQEHILTQALISLSLANLCFMNMWVQLFTLGSPSFSYYTPMPPDWRLLVALVFDIAVLSAVLFCAARLVDSRRRATNAIGFLLWGAASIFALHELRHLIVAALAKHFPRFYLLQPVLLLVVVVAIWLILRRSHDFWRRGLHLWTRTLLIFSPLFLILVLNLAWLYRTPVLRHLGAGRAAGMLPHPHDSAKRVIWIIFDEMDQHLAFEARPRRIALPNFDRLLAISLHATHALPPGPETLYSMPALITGRKISDVKTRPADLQLQFADTGRFALWSTQPNIFRRARAEGFDTGLSGWSHSYCRVIGKDLSDCFWAGYGGVGAFVAEDFFRGKHFFQRASYLADWQARSAPFITSLGFADEQPQEKFLFKRRQILEYQAIVKNAKRMLRNPELSLVLIHVPTPHPDGIWDTRTQSFTTDNRSNYLDNLELADKTLAEFRSILEAEGDWEQSAVLVSADHPFRAALWRDKDLLDAELERVTKNHPLRYIPFILKLPNEQKGMVYSRPFNTIVSQGLLLEILNGRIETPETASAWLDEHSHVAMPSA